MLYRNSKNGNVVSVSAEIKSDVWILVDEPKPKPKKTKKDVKKDE